jgi:hypothetical protein
MSPVTFIKGKNLLWLWLFPAALSWLLICCLKPTGRMTFGVEAVIISACCFAGGFALALKVFTVPKQRLLGGLFFTGSSLWLVFSVAFLGCLPMPQPYRSPAQIQAQQAQQESRMKAWVAGQIAPRDASADSTMLDLSPYYDALLGIQNSKNFHAVSPGTQVWNGVKFDVRAKVQLLWQDKEGVKGIPVGQKCSALYFLHGVERGMPSDIVSKFVVHLTGTNIETIPMVFGRDVAGEYLGIRNRLGVMPTNMIVWEERISTNGPPQPFRAFYVSRWINPFPDQPVETIDFAPGQPGNNPYFSPFLVAITVKPLSNINQ